MELWKATQLSSLGKNAEKFQHEHEILVYVYVCVFHPGNWLITDRSRELSLIQILGLKDPAS